MLIKCLKDVNWGLPKMLHKARSLPLGSRVSWERPDRQWPEASRRNALHWRMDQECQRWWLRQLQRSVTLIRGRLICTFLAQRIIFYVSLPDTYWTNPQFKITVTDTDPSDDDNKCTLVIGLMQKNMRKKGAAKFLTIGFCVYRVREYYLNLTYLSCMYHNCRFWHLDCSRDWGHSQAGLLHVQPSVGHFWVH